MQRQKHETNDGGEVGTTHVFTSMGGVEDFHQRRKRDRVLNVLLMCVEFILYPTACLFFGAFLTHTWPEFFVLVAPLGVVWFFVRKRPRVRSVRGGGRWSVMLGMSVAMIGIAGFLFSTYRIVPDVKNKVIVVYVKEHIWPPGKVTAGLFSSMKSVLGALAYGKMHGAAAVRVWLQDEYYSDPEQHSANYWGYFFEDLMLLREDITKQDCHQLEQVHFNQRWKRYGKWGGFNRVIDGMTPANYPLTYGVNRQGVNDLITKHIKLRPAVQAKIDAIRTEMSGATLALGVHYRGTDTAMHWPYVKIPYKSFFQEVDKAIQERLAEKGLLGKEAGAATIRIFVATDEQEFLEAMRSKYGAERVVSYEGSPRLTPDQYAAATEGLTNSPDVKVSNYEKGESAVVDAICLALGEHLIKSRSNVSEFSYAWNVDMAVTMLFNEVTYIPKGKF